jgi:hypothetical protein
LQNKAFKFPNKILLIYVQHERKKVFKVLCGKGDGLKSKICAMASKKEAFCPSVSLEIDELLSG